MPIDTATPNFGFPLPAAPNELSHDVTRLIDAITAIDAELINHVTTAAMNAAIASAVSALVASSPTALNTLKELADAMGDDPNFATTMTNLIGTKLGLGGGILSGLLTLAAAGLALSAGVDPDVNGKLTLVAGALKFMRSGHVVELIDDFTAQVLANKTLTAPTINGGVVSAIAAGATMKDPAGVSQPLGYMGIPSKAAKTAPYTLSINDAFFEIPTNSNITIPDNGSVAYPVGTMIAIRNTTPSTPLTVGIIAGSTDTLTREGTTSAGARTLAGNGVALLRKVSTTGWIIMGSSLS